MTDEIIDGIQRRMDGRDEDISEGTCWVLDDFLRQEGLPGINSARGGFDPEYIDFLQEMAELIERWSDAGEAGRQADCAFLQRQFNAKLQQAKLRFSGPFSRP